MKVFIIESSYPRDYYSDRLDGVLARNLLNTLGIQNRFKMVIDTQHFKKAIHDAANGGFDVIHLSCHGDDDGIALCDDTQPTWDEFLFSVDYPYSPNTRGRAFLDSLQGILGADDFAKLTHRNAEELLGLHTAV